MEEITHSNILLVEGKIDYDAWNYILKKNDLIDDFQIIIVEGVYNFSKWLKVRSKIPNFINIKKLALIRDADKDPEGSFASAKVLL